MEIRHITDCSNYFNYGQIDRSIIADSFSWQECEDIDVSVIEKHIELHSDKSHIYFFITKMCLYPLTFRNKYYGLWKEIGLSNNLKMIQSFEDKIEFNRYCLYFGIAEVPKSQLSLVLKLLQTDFMHSYILLSDSEFDYLSNFDSILKSNICGSNYFLVYSNLINFECKQNNLVTTIKGWNGTTINYFYHKNTERNIR